MGTERKLIKKIKNIRTGEKSKTIFLCKYNGSEKTVAEEFEINKVTGAGGSCVCYDAVCKIEGKSGNLKEFYPLDQSVSNSYFYLERKSDNQLIPSGDFIDAEANFYEARDEFINSYLKLRKIMEARETYVDFKTFIPDFTIYRGCDENGNIIENSTAYIWTENPKMETFEQFIKNVRKSPKKTPEHNLFVILNTILTLSECVNVLHDEGLLHLDLKPSNFGIIKRGNKHLTDNVSLFDVNTIYSIKSNFTSLSGTEGFRAPEVKNGKADSRSDIYSIGCTLFSAIIVNKNIEVFGYNRDFYNRIPELVESSELIAASETNSNIFLQAQLIKILSKCLAPLPRVRYQSCDDLIKDLRSSLIYLLPSEFESEVLSGQKLELKKYEKAFDRKNKKNSAKIFDYHLYKKPLFEFLYGDNLNVLILGFGNYSQKFLDSCLQAGQISGKTLNVKVVSNCIQRDKKLYLDARPTLTDFFNVDDSNPQDDSYGNIDFLDCEFDSGSDVKSNRRNGSLVKNILSENDYHYIFIALRDDALNKKIADICFENISDCSVNFAIEDRKYASRTKANPVCVNDVVEDKDDFKELERMAFNAHLVWSGVNVNLEDEKKKFKLPYNYKSSIACVLSIWSKLYSLGIRTTDYGKAAAEFKVKLSENPEIKEELIAVEHRRWCVEKICDGWGPLTDFDECAKNGRINESQKLHMCLVKSNAAQRLKESFSGVNETKWDTAKEIDMSHFDELEKASVKYHQALMKRAKKLKEEDVLSSSYVKLIREKVSVNKNTEIVFSEWFSCMKLIWHDDHNKVKAYKLLKQKFEKAIKELDEDSEKEITKLVQLIDDKFSTVLESMKYCDYKQSDVKLVEYIPFILTYKETIHLAIPFAVGNNNQVFSNIASASIVNPLKVTYLCYLNETQKNNFQNAVENVVSFMNNNHINIKSKLNFIILYDKSNNLAFNPNDLKQFLKSNYASRINSVIMSEVKSLEEIPDLFISFLNDQTNKVDAVEINETKLSYLLLGSGFYKKYPNYKFDSSTREFHSVTDCNFLQYIMNDRYFRVSDILGMRDSQGMMSFAPEFYNDYKNLWASYRNDVLIWKKMCALLCAYSEKEDVLASFSKDNDDCEYIRLSYIIPSFAYEAAKKIFLFLRDGVEIITDTSEITAYTSDSYKLTIFSPKKYKNEFNNMFSNPYLLTNKNHILFAYKKDGIKIMHNSLIVNNLCVKDYPNFEMYENKIKNLLNSMSQKGYITNYIINKSEHKFSFTYSTPQIKELLTTDGRILEIYVYHKCLESNKFDDVASSYEISWKNTPVKNEFDCIITSGYSCLFVECKARKNLEQDYYFKLSCLAKEFGINATAVLIADTNESKEDKDINDMQRTRGNMLGVVSITDSDEIDNIGATLSKVIKGEY